MKKTKVVKAWTGKSKEHGSICFKHMFYLKREAKDDLREFPNYEVIRVSIREIRK